MAQGGAGGSAQIKEFEIKSVSKKALKRLEQKAADPSSSCSKGPGLGVRDAEGKTISNKALKNQVQTIKDTALVQRDTGLIELGWEDEEGNIDIRGRL